ncbi:MAG: hypothetical protein H6832_07115 [Planctomycetes bacterium]|nr:hypothetical protein [Planctomycetota bacterium]MCB9890340.1 hypothetical protein [Planctomycetota bacterium]MCB9918158.1 hypothetical protein [Planctomycetota bacterium]
MSFLLVVDAAAIAPFVLIGASIGFTIAVLCVLTNSRERTPDAVLLGILCCAITWATVAAARRSEAMAQIQIVIAIVVTSIEILLVRGLDGKNTTRRREVSRQDSNENDG